MLEDENNKQVRTSTEESLKDKNILRHENDKHVGKSSIEPLKKKDMFRD